jgi:SAM-dependent methyltransferase
MLVLPAANRVYGRAAPALTRAELAVYGATVLDGRLTDVAEEAIGGVPYVAFSAPSLTDTDVRHLSNVSSLFALFCLEGEGDALRPVPLARLDRFDDDLVTIQRYSGKTNEQFTKLLLNAAVVCSGADYLAAPSSVRVLDPLAGRGTTLNHALLYGFSAAGVEADGRAVEAYEAFLRTWLKDKRIKHRAERARVRENASGGGGKVVGHRFDVSGDGLAVTMVHDDTRHVGRHFKRSSFDVVVADLPYGVQHTGDRSTRSPAALVEDAVAGWVEVLRSGGAMALAWNLRVLPREQLADVLAGAGLDVLEFAGVSFEHRVDQSIQRDVVVAVKR